MAASVKQIAEICCVSQSTVSKALSGRPDVGKDTRKRIRSVAERLNYVGNALVHGIQRGETMSIGVGYNGLSSAFGAGLLAEILRCLHRHNRQALTFDWDQEVGEGEKAIRSLVARRIDGLILFPPAHLPPQQYRRAMQKLSCPVVLVDQHSDELPFDFVGFDDRDGIRQIVAHLCDDLNINSIACLHYPKVSTGRERRAALLEELVRRGCKLPGSWDCAISLDPDADFQICKQLLEDRSSAPRALVCFNDKVALSALSAAQTLGLSVPEDVAIVGYGDLPVCQMVRPKITTVRQPLDQVAGQVMDLLLKRIAQHKNGPANSTFQKENILAAPDYIRVPVQLVCRNSTRASAQLNESLTNRQSEICLNT